MSDNAATLRSHLQAIAGFLPKFEEPGFVFGEWDGGKANAEGVITMPYFTLSDEAYSFVRTCNEHGWVEPFDWPAWAQTAEAIALWQNADSLNRATPDQLRKLLTVCIRRDRFVEGALASYYESGFLVRILKRAATLAEELGASPQQT